MLQSVLEFYERLFQRLFGYGDLTFLAMVLATLVTFLWPLIALVGYLAWQRSPSGLYSLMGLAGLLALVGVAMLATQGKGVGAGVAVIGGAVLILVGAGLAWWAWKTLP